MGVISSALDIGIPRSHPFRQLRNEQCRKDIKWEEFWFDNHNNNLIILCSLLMIAHIGKEHCPVIYLLLSAGQ